MPPAVTQRAVRALAEPAPAKVNLALHVTGRRADGYHELDSLVAFAAIADGDEVSVEFGEPGPDGPALEVTGPFAAHVPTGGENIVVAAARAVGGIARISLVKGLPVAAGIGGGSADAAAVLRAAARHLAVDRGAFADTALRLGADVPVCLAGRACRMAGIGERLTPVSLPRVEALFVNCGRPVATAQVFSRLERRDNPPLPPLPPVDGAAALGAWLNRTRNDLEPAALAVAPEIGTVLERLAQQRGCLLARMSGSGATVFGLFDSAASRDAAAQGLRAAAQAAGAPWWIRPAVLGG